ncbi:hypothetical protein BWR18_17595 [Tateyamaria omphalii]|uniref:Uncharacterized protein n=1 Tax=Tateyamaria omphalii TaxID=299262 RepID=A0A1P8MZ83_9RHOB|nr:hypothetical protein BWR18_17595 [Tateyamaria omphalii]
MNWSLYTTHRKSWPKGSAKQQQRVCSALIEVVPRFLNDKRAHKSTCGYSILHCRKIIRPNGKAQ